MSRELIFLPDVAQDLIEGKRYYGHLSPRSGAAHFEEAFKEAVRQVKGGIVTHAVAFKHYHRIHLRRFPYVLY